MMKTMLLGVLLLVVSVTASTYDFSFSGNVSYSGNNENWSYRRTNVVSFGVGNYAAGAYFSSISLGRTGNSASGDAIWGATYIGYEEVPLNFLAYWDAQINWGIGTDFVNLNATAAAAFIGSAYIAIEERTPNGTIVGGRYLENVAGEFSWSLTDSASPSVQNPDVSYATFTGQPPFASWSISITNVVSNVVGILTYANAVVSPKSLETIVQINNWNYVSTQNHLVLILGVLTGQGTASGNEYIYGSGSSSVYYSIGATAVVDGTVQNVEFSGYSTADYNGYISYMQNTTVFAQAQAKFQGSATARLATVSFPAGATQITYDPNVGSGSPVSSSNPSTSAAPAIQCGFLVVLVSVLLSLLF